VTSNILIQCGFYLLVLLALAKPLGEFFARALTGERTFLTPALGWLERLTYKASGVDPQREMRWTEYAAACALPRPSASASAKLANSTVNHSQRETARI
jgi:K+-transporting ATPase ATPase A chain